MADRLAYYSNGAMAVLAPRGWHCASLSGSGGGTLLVSPRREEVQAWFRLDGQARPIFGVQLTYTYGGTSGRFVVAAMIARMFPGHMDFARRVASEEYAGPLPSGPFGGDRIRRLSDTEVEFTTPPGRQGAGTGSTLASGEMPIDGLIILYPDSDMDMLQLSHRLPHGVERLVPLIMAEVRRSRGNAVTVPAADVVSR